MPKALVIALAGLAALTTAHAPTALGQGGLDRRLAAATRIECTFSTKFASISAGVPAIAVTPAEIEANFFDINVEEGTAEAESEYGASFISVRYESGYLHIMQMGGAGPLHVTTVLARAAGEGKLMAVHTRHEYSPTIIPGFTSRPEMYLGSCTIADPG